jgi:hypothetical protein
VAVFVVEVGARADETVKVAFTFCQKTNLKLERPDLAACSYDGLKGRHRIDLALGVLGLFQLMKLHLGRDHFVAELLDLPNLLSQCS